MKSIFAFILAALIITSCGSPETHEETTEPETQEQSTTQEEPEVESTPEVADVELVIESNDQMQYNLSELNVKAGQKVSLTLKHVGQMDKEVMGHNWVLLKAGTDAAAFATKAMDFKDSGFIPDDGKDVIAYTELIGGGESVTIMFDAPELGTYDFLCSFPAHFALMNGKFIVEE